MPEVTRTLPVTSKFFVNCHSEANSDKLTLFDLQLDAQNSYLFTYNTLKSSTCFEHYPAHRQEVYVVIVYMQPLV